MEDFEAIAQEVSALGQRASDLEARLKHVEKVNTGLEEARSVSRCKDADERGAPTPSPQAGPFLLAPRSPISPSVPAPLPAPHSSTASTPDFEASREGSTRFPPGTPSPSRESAPMARGIGRGTRQGLIVPFSLGVFGPY